MSDLTLLLDAAAAGDRQAAIDVLPLVYDELRKLAAVRIAAEAPGQTLDATALVHEAYLRLVVPEDFARWDNRGHFFAAAATAMRRIPVDRARRRRRRVHGGDRRRVELDADLVAARGPEDDVLALDDSLTRLAALDSVKARLVELRYFSGMTTEQAAEVLGISVKTAGRYRAFARAWLQRDMDAEAEGEKSGPA